MFTHPIHGPVDVSDAATAQRLRQAACELSTLYGLLKHHFHNTTDSLRLARLRVLDRELRAQAGVYDPRGCCTECGGPHKDDEHEEADEAYTEDFARAKAFAGQLP